MLKFKAIAHERQNDAPPYIVMRPVGGGAAYVLDLNSVATMSDAELLARELSHLVHRVRVEEPSIAGAKREPAPSLHR